MLKDQSQTFTLFAATNAAFEAIGASHLPLEEIKTILMINILVGVAETFDSLVCNGLSSTMLGEDTKTMCAEVAARTVLRQAVSSGDNIITEKYQEGKGNVEAKTKPKIDLVVIKSGNGNILQMDQVILPGIDPMSE